MTAPRVIVLILSYNGKHLLDDSISTYLANDYENFDVAVIDNGSTDGTKEFVESKYPGVKVVRTDVNLKYSGGLNFGMKYAFDQQKADFALITNNDVKVDSKVISALVKTAVSREDIAFTIGKVYFFDAPDTFQTVGKREDPVRWNGGHIGNQEKDNGQYDEAAERAFCDDIYWLVNRKIYDLVGGYNTEFAFQGEDFEWQVRAKRAGYKIYYTPEAKIWHKESMTIGKTSPFKAYYDARNPLIAHMMYRTPEQLKVYIRLKIKEHLKGTWKPFLKLRWEYVYKNWAGFLSALRWGMKHKKFSLKLLF